MGRHDVVNVHERRDEVQERGTIAERQHVGHGAAQGLIGEMLLFDGHFLFLHSNSVCAAHCDHGLLHPVFHPFDDRGHADEAGHAQDDPEHREQRSKLVRPDFFQAGGDGVQEGHRGVGLWSDGLLD